VVDIRVDVGGILLVVFFQGGLVGGPAFVDTCIQTCIVDQERRFYLWHLVERWLGTVERNGGGEIGQADGHHIADPAAEAKAYDAYFAVDVGLLFEVFECGDKIFEHLVLVSFRLHFAAFVVVAGIAAQRRQRIWCNGDESCQGHSSAHVFDIGVEAAVLVYHDDGAEFIRGGGGFR